MAAPRSVDIAGERASIAVRIDKLRSAPERAARAGYDWSLAANRLAERERAAIEALRTVVDLRARLYALRRLERARARTDAKRSSVGGSP